MTPRSLRDSPRIQPDLTWPLIQYIHVLDELDWPSRPIVHYPSGYSAFRNRRMRCHRLCLKRSTSVSVCKVNGAGGLCCPFIRREKGSARGDFQEENREPMVHDCRDAGGRAMPGAIAEDVPPARSRSGGFLTEGSAQRRIGMGNTAHPLH